MQHGVIGHTLAEFLILRGIGQIAIQQQIGNFEEARFFGQLINGIAAIQQNAGIAINIGDGAFAGSGRAIAGVKGENPKIAIKLADIGNLRPQRAAQQGQRRAFVGAIQRDGNGPLGLRGHACLPQKTVTPPAQAGALNYGAVQDKGVAGRLANRVTGSREKPNPKV